MRATVNTNILLIFTICAVLSCSQSAPIMGTKSIALTETRKRFVIIDSISRGEGKVDDDDDKKDKKKSKGEEQDENPSKNKRSSNKGAPNKNHRFDGERDDDDDGDEPDKKKTPSKKPVRSQSKERAKTTKKKELKKDEDDDDGGKRQVHQAPQKKRHSAHKTAASPTHLPPQQPFVAKKPVATHAPVATQTPQGKSKTSSAVGVRNEGSDRDDDDDDDDDGGKENKTPTDPNRLVARSVEDFRDQFLKFMRNPNSTYYFINLFPFRDNFCTEKGVRDVPCLRAVIMDVNMKNFSLDITGAGYVDTFGFVFADSKGVYVSHHTEDDYITVMTPETDRDNKAIRNFITRQSRIVEEAPHVTAKCTENIPRKITLPGPRTVVPHAKNDCEPRECLSLSVLARVPHIKVTGPQTADVLCYRDLCATPVHRVQVHPRAAWITMREFCGDLRRGCTREKHMVAKAILETTEWYGLRFGVVYGEGRVEAAITSAIQVAIDVCAETRRRVARIAGAVRVETSRSCLAQ